MEKKLQKLDAGTRHLDKGLEITALACLIISVTGAAINVILRYGFDMSYQILEEICRYSIIYGVFAYIGPLIKRGEHLKMDILQDLLKGRAKHVNQLIISILLFASFAFLCWSGTMWTLSLLAMNVMTVSGIMLMFIPAVAIPIGMFLGCIYSFLEIIQAYYKIRYFEEVEEVSPVDPETNMANTTS